MDGLDDLQADVETKSRKQRSRREEATPAPRKPKPAQPASSGPQQDETQADASAHAHTGVPVHEQTGTPAPSRPEPAEPPELAARTRPPSVEAYLTEDLMDWMWTVRAAGMRQRRDNVTSAVVRLALEQMRERMSPKEIITALEEAPSAGQGKNRRGRRR